jgi:hypothetical protein
LSTRKPEVVVFTGPTLRPGEVRELLGGRAEVLPPVAQGDLYRAATSGPLAIGIIDGYFDRVPSVWHKEILWAMAEGIHVFGAASMGALRAAELATFGMVGVGQIFQAFQSGELEDDDEVAVAHAEEGQDYAAASEALVNIRFTLAAAVAQGVIDEGTRASLVGIAKSLFYPDRVYATILGTADRAGVAVGTLNALRDWLPRGRIDQKRADAMALTRALQDLLAGPRQRAEVGYRFEQTDAWEGARQHFQRTSPVRGSTSTRTALMEELKIAGMFPSAREGALARYFALEEGRRLGHATEGDARAVALESFRRQRRLYQEADLQRWATEQRLAGGAGLDAFIEEQGVVQWVERVFAPEAEACIEDWLRARGELGPVATRAEHKSAVLADAGLSDPTLADADLTEAQFLTRHFGMAGRAVPVDLQAEAQACGFESKEEMVRALLRDFFYRSLTRDRA